jgi:hypothetical protein
MTHSMNRLDGVSGTVAKAVSVQPHQTSNTKNCLLRLCLCAQFPVRMTLRTCTIFVPEITHTCCKSRENQRRRGRAHATGENPARYRHPDYSSTDGWGRRKWRMFKTLHRGQGSEFRWKRLGQEKLTDVPEKSKSSLSACGRCNCVLTSAPAKASLNNVEALPTFCAQTRHKMWAPQTSSLDPKP